MKDRDIEFRKKNKLYVADFLAWIEEAGLEEATQPLTLATVKPEEVLGTTRRQNNRAMQVKDFVRRAGFPLEQEAINLSRDGNFDAMPIDPTDIRAGFHVGDIRKIRVTRDFLVSIFSICDVAR